MRADDIDHLGNRRVRAVGELLQNQFRMGLIRMERIIKERMTISDSGTITSASLINARPVVAAIKEFFGSSQLSQFMDQTNPLAELTHKRRLSALGPGGLSRERAGFDVRDVHQSHYGRICPIETPEGPNIGLIGSLATFARVNEFGFIETPFRRVHQGRRTAPRGSATTSCSSPPTRRTSTRSRRRTRPSTTKGHYRGAARRVPHAPHLQGSAHQPTSIIMDVSPKQIVSVATALIPFLEHDDANRALMGSNMQKQAVPAARHRVADRRHRHGGTRRAQLGRDGAGAQAPAPWSASPGRSRRTTTAPSRRFSAGRTAASASWCAPDDGGPDQWYGVHKFVRSNQGTCLSQRITVFSGAHVDEGDVLADGPSTDDGELALGRNVLVAFMPWEGYNFEDAILISESRRP